VGTIIMETKRQGQESRVAGNSQKRVGTGQGSVTRSTARTVSTGRAVAAGRTAGARNTSAVGRAAGSAQRTGKAPVAEKKVKAAGKPDMRLLVVSIMGIFMLAASGWGVTQMVRMLNTRGQMATYEEVQSIKKIEDNSKNVGKTIDVDGLVEKILNKVVFDAELNKLDDSVAEGMVETTEGTKLQFYVGNGTYADELLIMTAKSEKDAKENQENAKAHLTETRQAFQDYIPKEAEKIDHAVSVRCGCYVIVCVTADYETAEKTINAVIQE